MGDSVLVRASYPARQILTGVTERSPPLVLQLEAVVGILGTDQISSSPMRDSNSRRLENSSLSVEVTHWRTDVS